MNTFEKVIMSLSIIALAIVLYFFSEERAREGSSYQYLDNRVIQDDLAPLPDIPKLNPHRVALGKYLFHDKRLSGTNKISCASCHDLESGGDDDMRIPMGVAGPAGELNTPTIFNASLNFALFWDGRIKSLEEQAASPILNPKEMGGNWDDIRSRLERDPDAMKLLQLAYPGKKYGEETITSALADFQRTLLTVDSRFDRYLKGYDDSLNPIEQKGYRLFKNMGCASCHSGQNIGGNSFQKIGKMNKFFTNREPKTSDYGRYNVTKKESDRFKFRVPSLRNVEHTAPYFHDGSAKTLAEAVETMAWVQLDIRPSREDIDYLVAFLKSLSAPRKVTTRL